MTQTTATADPEVRAGSPASHHRALLPLARVEAIRLLRHPLHVAAFLLIAGPIVYWHVTGSPEYRFPVLHQADAALQMPVAYLIGGAVLIASNLAVLRDHRRGVAEASNVLALPPWWRVGAHAVGLLPVAVVAAVLVLAQIGYLAVTGVAVGRPDPWQLATGPVNVVLFGAIGILLGRLVRSVVVAPLVLVVFAAATIVFSVRTSDGFDSTRLYPVQMDVSHFAPVPVDLEFLPTGGHLLYLVGLAGLALAVALMRAGSRAHTVTAGLVVAVLVTVGAVVAQSRPPGADAVAAAEQASEHPAQVQTCRRVDQINYCAFPDFTPWIKEWDAVVRGVLRYVPADVAARPVTVRQRIKVSSSSASVDGVVVPPPPVDLWRADDIAAGTPVTITVGSSWGDGWAETALAGHAAFYAMSGDEVPAQRCDARGVLLVWFAGRATPGAEAMLHAVDANSWGGLSFSDNGGFSDRLGVPDWVASTGFALLDRPTAEIAGLILRHWTELTAPGTTPERAGELLGVTATQRPTNPDDAACG